MSDMDDEVPVATGSSAQSVDKWRAQLFPPQPSGKPHSDAWKHLAAASLHRWRAYQHHHNGPMELTREDYEAALEAASKTDANGGGTPHQPALYGAAK